MMCIYIRIYTNYVCLNCLPTRQLNYILNNIKFFIDANAILDNDLNYASFKFITSTFVNPQVSAGIFFFLNFLYWLGTCNSPGIPNEKVSSGPTKEKSNYLPFLKIKKNSNRHI